jgi:hypothetical protein
MVSKALKKKKAPAAGIALLPAVHLLDLFYEGFPKSTGAAMSAVCSSAVNCLSSQEGTFIRSSVSQS